MKSIFFKRTRKLTISSILVKAQFKRSIKPKLTLSGDWMAQAGFCIGDSIQIEIFENKLIITNNADSNKPKA